jgi:hypothetical protein
MQHDDGVWGSSNSAVSKRYFSNRFYCSEEVNLNEKSTFVACSCNLKSMLAFTPALKLAAKVANKSVLVVNQCAIKTTQSRAKSIS